jgi:L-asparaginase II
MANPVVVEATRGKRIESAHRGAGAVVDADGRVVMAFGDAERAIRAPPSRRCRRCRSSKAPPRIAWG